MMRRFALVTVAAAMGLGTAGGGIALAGVDAPAASIRIVDRPAVLRVDGGIRFVIAAKCDSRLQAFELGASATQYRATGFSLTQAPPAVVTCDGERHRQRVVVHPSTGNFVPGRVDVSVYLGLYDPQEDEDLSREAARTLTLVSN